MAVSSKKKNKRSKSEPMNWLQLSSLENEWHFSTINKIVEKMPLKFSVLRMLSREMSRSFKKYIDDAQIMFNIQDEFAAVSAELVGYDYNNRLHCGVGCYHIVAVNKKSGNTLDQIYYKTSWSSKEGETFFEAIDNILDTLGEEVQRKYSDITKKD